VPLQNRVDPFGKLFRTQARGTMMGNRGGALHNGEREIVRSYKSRRWITCVLEFRGRQRAVMSEGRYTELFFLDEAVSFAAGHRPCAECRRERFNAFKAAWGGGPFADAMDRELHAARKVTYEARLGSLPDGCFVEMDGHAYLVHERGLLLWTPDGYTERIRTAGDSMVRVLTPEPAVRCLQNGYKAQVHDSVILFAQSL
jgi:hypothetical protein